MEFQSLLFIFVFKSLGFVHLSVLVKSGYEPRIIPVNCDEKKKQEMEEKTAIVSLMRFNYLPTWKVQCDGWLS